MPPIPVLGGGRLPPPQSKQTFRGCQIQDGTFSRKKSRVYGPDRKLMPTRMIPKKPMPLQVCVSIYEHIYYIISSYIHGARILGHIQDNERLLQVKRPLCYHTISSNDVTIWSSPLGGKVIGTQFPLISGHVLVTNWASHTRSLLYLTPTMIHVEWP